MRILVIGAGVSGLTTAHCLSDAGHQVKAIADKFAPDVVSNVAGALWEWPPAICGHSNLFSDNTIRCKAWCKESYAKFIDLSWDSDVTGVYLRMVNYHLPNSLWGNPEQACKMKELSQFASEVHEIETGYAFRSPAVDTDRYMEWLREETTAKGVTTAIGKISGCLKSQIDELLNRQEVDLIVNCTGLGAAGIGHADVSPLRGAVAVIGNDGSEFPKVEEAHCSYSEGGNGFLFVLPRGKNRLLLGGFAEMGESSTEIGIDYGPVQEMLKRCVRFMPFLENPVARLRKEQVKVGLRPYRGDGPRVERDGKVIHNYGHGGSGVTMSWGCAEEVVRLAESN